MQLRQFRPDLIYILVIPSVLVSVIKQCVKFNTELLSDQKLVLTVINDVTYSISNQKMEPGFYSFVHYFCI